MQDVGREVAMDVECDFIGDSVVTQTHEHSFLWQWMIEHADDLLSIENGADKFVYVSSRAADLFGWTRSDLLGNDLQSMLHAEDRQRVVAERAALRRMEFASSRCSYRLRCSSGHYCWVESRSRLAPQWPYLITVTRDVDDSMRRMQDLERLATRDSLTNLLNRRAIEAELHAGLARSRQRARTLSIALFDIDDFKRVNDTRGHLAGDDLLRTLSACISRNMRTYDLMGRWGGDEFLLTMPDTCAEAAWEVVNRLRDAVAMDLPGVTLSFGISCSDDADSIDGLLMQADAALYLSKRRGGRKWSTVAQPGQISIAVT